MNEVTTLQKKEINTDFEVRSLDDAFNTQQQKKKPGGLTLNILLQAFYLE